jgi:pilus assembly protein Flp/PilA
MLARIRQTVAFFLKNENGPTSVEYAVILGVIVVIAATAITSLGNSSSEKESTPKNAAQVHKTSR